jgi:hypothetical protein
MLSISLSRILVSAAMTMKLAVIEKRTKHRSCNRPTFSGDRRPSIVGGCSNRKRRSDRKATLWNYDVYWVFDVCNEYTPGPWPPARDHLQYPVPTPLKQAVANMRVIEAVVRCGRGNTWVEVSSSPS